MEEKALAMLDARRMRVLFDAIGRMLAEAGQRAEISVYGGSALILMYDFREATRDIDYVPMLGNAEIVSRIADEIGRRENLPEGWLNDAVSIFTSDRPDFQLVGDFPAGAPGLRVYSASPRYLLAMKVMAMRSSLETSDVSDIWHLVDICGIESVEDARAVVGEYFPGKRIPRRNDLILEDLFETKSSGLPYSRAIGY